MSVSYTRDSKPRSQNGFEPNAYSPETQPTGDPLSFEQGFAAGYRARGLATRPYGVGHAGQYSASVAGYPYFTPAPQGGYPIYAAPAYAGTPDEAYLRGLEAGYAEYRASVEYAAGYRAGQHGAPPAAGSPATYAYAYANAYQRAYAEAFAAAQRASGYAAPAGGPGPHQAEDTGS